MISDYNLLNHVLDTFTKQIQAWYPLLLMYGLQLLVAMALATFLYIGVQAASSHNFVGIITAFELGLIRIGIAYFVIDHADTWGNAMIQTGIDIGRAVSGQSPQVLTPSGILNAGLQLVFILGHAKAVGGWLPSVQGLEMFVAQLTVFLSFVAAALIYLGLLIEGAWTIYTGPIFICFAPLEYTTGMLINWAKQLLAIALHIAILLLVISTGMLLAADWSRQLADNSNKITTDIGLVILSMAMGATFFWVVKTVPQRVVGTVSAAAAAFGFGLGGALGEAASAAGGAASSGAAAAGKAQQAWVNQTHSRLLMS